MMATSKKSVQIKVERTIVARPDEVFEAWHEPHLSRMIR
jgi:uncharacterized protein YndB with AHSA1/START domain